MMMMMMMMMLMMMMNKDLQVAFPTLSVGCHHPHLALSSLSTAFRVVLDLLCLFYSFPLPDYSTDRLHDLV